MSRFWGDRIRAVQFVKAVPAARASPGPSRGRAPGHSRMDSCRLLRRRPSVTTRTEAKTVPTRSILWINPAMVRDRRTWEQPRGVLLTCVSLAESHSLHATPSLPLRRGTLDDGRHAGLLRDVGGLPQDVYSVTLL